MCVYNYECSKCEYQKIGIKQSTLSQRPWNASLLEIRRLKFKWKIAALIEQEKYIVHRDVYSRQKILLKKEKGNEES